MSQCTPAWADGKPDFGRNIRRRQPLRQQPFRLSNGSEAISPDLDLRGHQKGVIFDFSRPGKPRDNAFIESFDGKFRQECLNSHWLMKIWKSTVKNGNLARGLHNVRPHSAIGNNPPVTLTSRSQGAPLPEAKTRENVQPGGPDKGLRSKNGSPNIVGCHINLCHCSHSFLLLL